MYVKKILIDKMMGWIRGITPKTPRPTVLMAYGKLAALYEIGILTDAEYEREYDELKARSTKTKKTKKTKDETAEMFQMFKQLPEDILSEEE